MSYGTKPYYHVKELSGCEVVNKLHLTLDIYQSNEMTKRVGQLTLQVLKYKYLKYAIVHFIRMKNSSRYVKGINCNVKN